MAIGHAPRRLADLARALLLAEFVTTLIGACAEPVPDPTSTPSGRAIAPVATAPASRLEPLGSIPEDARVSSGGPDPRSAGYWTAWSTCGTGSQAEVARQNGGRAAGWILLDDLIVDPGLALGKHDIVDCPEAIAILDRSTDGAPSSEVGRLAHQVLVAELNLSSGAETCVAVEGAVALGQSLLVALGLDGRATARTPDTREAPLVAETADVLADYNAGDLCR